MANRQVGAILHHLSKLVDKETATQLTDGQLLQRFSAHRDEDAFAALMQRHSGLVYGVCRHILHQEQDAEDAFQSTFLVLARQAGSIRRQTAVGSWLYQVAFRIAVKVRKATVRRRERETQAAQPEEEHPSSELSWRELQAILDEELNCLPEKYRAPFVLCCLTGKSKPEAAAELGWKEGTVSSRLAHARELLQKRLARRGVTLSAVLCGLAVAPHAGLAAVPAPLIAATLKAAMSFVAGVPTAGAASAQALACAHAMLRAMVVARLAWVAAVLAVMGLVVGAAAVVAPRTPPEAPKAASQAPAPNPKQGPQPAREGRGAAEVKPATPDRGQRMTVGGRVLGVDGNPIPGVRVAAVAAQYQTPGEINGPASLNMQLLGEGQADEQGQFLIAVPQTTAAHYRLTALATAPGYALTSRMVDHYRVTAPEHTVPLTLVRARDVRGRLVDLQGAPAAGVRVHVLGISRGEPGAVFFQFGEPPVRLPGWPDSAVTDAKGYFTLRGLAPGTTATLQVRDERFATQWLTLTTTQTGQAQPAVLSLMPARTIEGRLKGDGTDEPLAGVTVVVEGHSEPYSAVLSRVAVQTDDQGRYRTRPFPGKYYDIWAYPPHGMPYLVLNKRIQWPAGAAQQQADLTLQRGVLVRGTVKEAGSGRPISGAGVRYNGLGGSSRISASDPKARSSTRDVHSAADGTFQFTVPTGLGHLLAKAAEPDYLHTEITLGQLIDGRKGGRPMFPDAVVPMHLKTTKESKDISIQLRRGVTLRGRVVGHDGHPVASGWVIAPTYVPHGHEFKGNTLPVRNGRFEVPGCEPGRKIPLWFYDPQKLQGAMVELSAGAGPEPEVKLMPCTSARGRFLDPARKLILQPKLMTELVLRPGDNENESLHRGTPARLGVWATLLHGPDYERIEPGGRVTFPYLIPGATYLIRAEERLGWPERLLFTAPQTGTLELQDVITEPRPPRAEKNSRPGN